MFIILSGSSGSGKNTIINHFLKENENNKFLLTNTTREIREGEVNGKVYNFLTKNEFQKKIKDKELIEHEIIHGNFYGTSWEEFNNHNNLGHTLFKDIGVQGTFNIADKCGEKTQVIKIFLFCKKRDLINRLKKRGEKNIKLRMKRFKFENSFKNKYDYVIENNNFENSCLAIQQIINIKNNPEQIYPVKNIKNINSKKIGKYMEKIKTGKQLKPVKVVITKEGIFILNGIERYIASIKMKKDICKKVKFSNKKYEIQNKEDWKQILYK